MLATPLLQCYDLVLHSRESRVVLVLRTSPRAADDFSSNASCPLQLECLTRRSDVCVSRGIHTSSSLESTAARSPFHACPATSLGGNTGELLQRVVSSHVLRSRAGVLSTRSARRQFRFTSALRDVGHCECAAFCLLLSVFR